MAIRCGGDVEIIVACAMIGRHLRDTDDYLKEKAAIAELARRQAVEHGFQSPEVAVNAADDVATGSIYLTVTGTSAEAGDDGQVGRGNRVNGLITPCRPVSLEAAAGKNPVTHVGKIYNVVAQRIAQALVDDIPAIAQADCLLVSKIGTPVTSPALVQIKLATRDGAPAAALRKRIEEITADRLAYVPRLVDEFVAGAIAVF